MIRRSRIKTKTDGKKERKEREKKRGRREKEKEEKRKGREDVSFLRFLNIFAERS